MKFSIITSVYNEEKLIRSELSNAIAQIRRYKVDAEILVGVDGDDDTAAIARSYGKKFKNLKVYKFAKRKGRIGTLNFLVARAKGEITINIDPDRLLKVNLNDVEKAFRDKEVGALVSIDNMARDSISEGQRIFERTYMDFKLRKYLRDNVATEPVFNSYIFRNRVVQSPYYETTQDDAEVVYKIMRAGYKVIYVKHLAVCLPDNPLMPRLTVSDIMKRRTRNIMFKSEASRILKTEEFSFRNRFGDFALISLFAVGRCISNLSVLQLASLLKYLAIVFVALSASKIKSLFPSTSGDGWLPKYRVAR